MTTKDHGYWRSLEELANTPEFRRFAEGEFPSEWSEPVNRRKWLRIMASSMALAGLSSCMREPTERIVPYVRAPEDVVPGKPLFFATAATLAGFAKGVLVESHMGRPTKVEGNPQHPASLGATDVFTQASVLTLYDPDRSQVVTHAGRISSWVALIAALNLARQEQLPKKGAGLRILTGTITSPALADQIRTLLAEFPNARWYQHEPVGRENIYTGAQLAFGDAVAPIYRFDKADVIVALDADFLGWGPGNLRYTRDFTSRRRVDAMNRLYARGEHSDDHRIDGGSPPARPSRRGRAVRARPGAPVGTGGRGKSRRARREVSRRVGSATCAAIAAPASWWPETSSHQQSTRWPTPSTTNWATTATRSISWTLWSHPRPHLWRIWSRR